MLERYPNIDRPSVAFPTELVDFFFDQRGQVYTEEEERVLSPLVEFEEAVCTSSDGQSIYITSHLFFEDLANLEKIIPQDGFLSDLSEGSGDLDVQDD